MHIARVAYTVEPSDEGWTVSFCTLPHGHFERRIDALRSAVFDGDRVQRMGNEVVIEIARPDGCPPLPRRTLRFPVEHRVPHRVRT